MSLGNLDIADLHWRKARRSANNGACVEVAAAGLRVLVRDSKDQDGPVMQYSESAWRAFLAYAKAGRSHPDSL
jgi:hypothetical protein